ncbi:hypothetical protein [Sporosalibacterium faouarense]|uniref:hypothetical protein n=1 Tax=Sporosalibacterium faouarense TaxID=516123 RepID=UPI00192B77C9|nr:hypothetical protein [Sporosalibacterium faouarense]
MRSKTQREFRKQMKKHNKELKNNKDENAFYSYIRKDFISSYYSKFNKKKVIYLSSTLLLIIYILFRVTMSGMFSYVGRNTNYSNASLSNNNLFINKQSKVSQYIDEIKVYKRNINTMISYRSENLNKVKDSVSRDEFLNQVQLNIDTIDVYIVEIKEIDHINDLDKYHSKYLETVELTKQLFVETCTIEEINTQEDIDLHIARTKKIINSINDNYKILTDELKLVLEKLDMRYEETTDGIRFWYQDDY